ncbi:serine hydrolase domain-containing protein [Neoroseomonas oryzicola]|uniref:Serine hydrolase n=1 Tax=Neoroseomonas oryzicola TaxID=535904 RepID=A0A9X9WHG9_9PROT|nr:serine hydrolase domain-containing protein [Neoroseomonas oryzicola]MBR0659779.1 serine hydrolase [Neoroseomonas oryzicola]NKE19789.1 serine hydrolase [Neoroseomonas oryzicola]
MTPPDWTAALVEAEAIVAAWAAPGEAAPGGTILLFDRDGIRGQASAGLASLQHGIPFTPRTPSRFASITKHLLCAYALHRGIDLAAPLGALVPGLPDAIGSVPVVRALSMTSGIPDLLQSYMLCGVPASAAVDAAALDAFTAALPGLDFAPGSEMSYSNTGYRLVEHALARQGGAFAAWVEVPLNAALGTGFRFPTAWDRPLAGLADGYWREGPDAPWRVGSYGMALSGSGALAGSAEDLATWLRALLRGDGPAGDVLARLATPATLADGRASHYGLGMHVTGIDGVRLVGHGGHLPGFKNHVLLDPATGSGVVLLSNREETEPYLPALRVMARLLGIAPPCLDAPALPRGLFVEASGPTWLELGEGSATFMGSRDTLLPGATEGEAVALSPYLPMRLRRDGADIVGEVGHAARRFHPVAADARLDAGLAGTWRAAAMHAELSIAIAADGGATASMGSGPLHRVVPLTPLAADRAIMPVGALPWPGRACLWLRAPGVLRIATNRSRVIDFQRV